MDKIASRIVILHKLTGEEIEYEFQVGRPYFEEGKNWWCPVVIIGPQSDKVHPIAGEDSLQSLNLALNFLGQRIKSLEKSLGGKFLWEKGKSFELGKL